MKIKQTTTFFIFIALFLGVSCSTGPVKEKAVEQTGETVLINADEAAFLQNLASLCGKSFAGREIYSKSGRNSWAGKILVMHVTVCEPTQVHIPFHINDDKSRTWMFLAEEGKLRFRHDHRHDDGTPENQTLYGGFADGTGNGFAQNFPADEYTNTLLADNIERKWTIALSENLTTMSYQLHYAGEMVFEAEFDLTKPLDN